ncbi:hypothetical protein ATANTOWER_028125 [Ataeniobius toweri]|uniref:Uncharacterized protein n=1 Tax=Ataeniobius toweri TaxID=208326 RepID=A0ABU7AWI4_9TELE|nr:hypothetical protein [Ataeniobius toweri]
MSPPPSFALPSLCLSCSPFNRISSTGSSVIFIPYLNIYTHWFSLFTAGFTAGLTCLTDRFLPRYFLCFMSVLPVVCAFLNFYYLKNSLFTSVGLCVWVLHNLTMTIVQHSVIN